MEIKEGGREMGGMRRDEEIKGGGREMGGMRRLRGEEGKWEG